MQQIVSKNKIYIHKLYIYDIILLLGWCFYMNLKDFIADVPDFPQAGILFRDITPLLANGEAFSYCCDKLVEFAKKVGATLIVGPESRGFIFGCPVATKLGLGFVPIRKPGKLPREQVHLKENNGMMELIHYVCTMMQLNLVIRF